MKYLNEITITALLKSIIESGAPAKDWDKLLKDAVRVYVDMCRSLEEAAKKKKG